MKILSKVRQKPIFWEKGYAPEFLTVFFELNQTLAKTNLVLEGNVCYPHGCPPEVYINSPPSLQHDFVVKRRNLIKITSKKRRMLEIGMNGGHSALLVLHHNPELEIHCVDICYHAYTRLAAEFLKQKYPERFFFYAGDSREVLPDIAIQQRHLKFDVIHVDGGHSESLCRTDMSNSIRLAANKCTLILDDTQAPYILKIYHEFLKLGFLRRQTQFKLEKTILHKVAEVIPEPTFCGTGIPPIQTSQID